MCRSLNSASLRRTPWRGRPCRDHRSPRRCTPSPRAEACRTRSAAAAIRRSPRAAEIGGSAVELNEERRPDCQDAPGQDRGASSRSGAAQRWSASRGPRASRRGSRPQGESRSPLGREHQRHRESRQQQSARASRRLRRNPAISAARGTRPQPRAAPNRSHRSHPPGGSRLGFGRDRLAWVFRRSSLGGWISSKYIGLSSPFQRQYACLALASLALEPRSSARGANPRSPGLGLPQLTMPRSRPASPEQGQLQMARRPRRHGASLGPVDPGDDLTARGRITASLQLDLRQHHQCPAHHRDPGNPRRYRPEPAVAPQARNGRRRQQARADHGRGKGRRISQVQSIEAPTPAAAITATSTLRSAASPNAAQAATSPRQ